VIHISFPKSNEPKERHGAKHPQCLLEAFSKQASGRLSNLIGLCLTLIPRRTAAAKTEIAYFWASSTALEK